MKRYTHTPNYWTLRMKIDYCSLMVDWHWFKTKLFLHSILVSLGIHSIFLNVGLSIWPDALYAIRCCIRIHMKFMNIIGLFDKFSRPNQTNNNNLENRERENEEQLIRENLKLINTVNCDWMWYKVLVYRLYSPYYVNFSFSSTF